MKSKSLKRWLSVALSVSRLVVLGSAALAEGGKMTRTEWNDKLLGAQDFLFKHTRTGWGSRARNCPFTRRRMKIPCAWRTAAYYEPTRTFKVRRGNR